MIVLKSLAVITCVGLSSVSAISFKTVLDPVMRVASNYLDGRSSGIFPVSEDVSENLSDAARFLFVNLTSTATTISYTNALLLILGISTAIFLAFLIAAAVAYLLASDLINGVPEQSSSPEDDASFDQEQSLDSTARFLFLNSSSTISASYALFIILAISFALFAGLLLIYLLVASLFGTGLGGYKYGGNSHGYKRSLYDEMEEYNLTKIVEILALMEEEFRRVGGAWVYEEECKQRALCELTAKTGVFGTEGAKMSRLVQDLQQATESSHLEGNVNHEPALQKANSYIKASQKGHTEGECIRAYPKCSS